jgi:hypothetical protein
VGFNSILDRFLQDLHGTLGPPVNASALAGQRETSFPARLLVRRVVKDSCTMLCAMDVPHLCK